jgi:chemotaxis protein CheX
MESFDNVLRETVRNIWTVILGLEVQEGLESAPALAKLNSGRTLTACVQLAGAWEGSVLLYCTADLARRSAAVMFGMEPDGMSDEDIEDALGELANMTGGNVKALLPQPCELSLPAVVEGIDYRFVVPGSKVVSNVLLECEGDPFLVTVLEKAEVAGGPPGE